MIKKIIVVGGGTSGLVTAMLLKNAYPKIKINVVESSSIDIIGVGEGTTEHWKEFVNRLKLPQDELFLETDATIKVGTKFVNWNNDGKSYWHSILNEYSSCYVNRFPNHYAYVIANNIDPSGMVHEYMDRSIFTPNFVAHQCHFDTFKLNKYLHKKASQQGITFINAKINSVNLATDGCVSSLIDEVGNVLSADFFIDASGFNRVIMKHLDTKWIDYSKYLPVNRAIAFQTPGVEDINAFTTSTSMKNGWMWNAPTQKRYGNGYVFCDGYTTSDQAVEEVEAMLGHSINVAKDIKFAAGKLDKFMKKNCVAVGLSAMFVEPLEASSISSSIQQAFCLVNMLTNYSRDNIIVEKRYNELFDKVFDNIVDFIQIHYITKRDDTAFWKEKPFELTDFNKETLPVFKKSMPTFNFFDNSFTLYRENNWIMVLYGLGFFNTDSIKKLWEDQPDWLQEGVTKDYFDRKNINQNLGISMLSHRDVIKLVLSGNKNII
jgi:tryptophan halogenase